MNEPKVEAGDKVILNVLIFRKTYDGYPKASIANVSEDGVAIKTPRYEVSLNYKYMDTYKYKMFTKLKQ